MEEKTQKDAIKNRTLNANSIQALLSFCPNSEQADKKVWVLLPLALVRNDNVAHVVWISTLTSPCKPNNKPSQSPFLDLSSHFHMWLGAWSALPRKPYYMSNRYTFSLPPSVFSILNLDTRTKFWVSSGWPQHRENQFSILITGIVTFMKRFPWVLLAWGENLRICSTWHHQKEWIS